jgi:hypothetical protein
MAKPELVGHDAFYMKELNDMIDIRRDYDLWQARRVLHMVCLSLVSIELLLLAFSFRTVKLSRSVIIHFSSI